MREADAGRQRRRGDESLGRATRAAPRAPASREPPRRARTARRRARPRAAGPRRAASAQVGGDAHASREARRRAGSGRSRARAPIARACARIARPQHDAAAHGRARGEVARHRGSPRAGAEDRDRGHRAAAFRGRRPAAAGRTRSGRRGGAPSPSPAWRWSPATTRVSASSSSTFCSARNTTAAASSGLARTSATGTRTTSIRLSARPLPAIQPMVPPASRTLVQPSTVDQHLDRDVAAVDEQRLAPWRTARRREAWAPRSSRGTRPRRPRATPATTTRRRPHACGSARRRARHRQRVSS